MSGQQVPEASASTGRGFGRILVFVYGVFALAATGRSALQLATKASEAPLPYALSAFAAVVYIVATVSLARSGRTSYRVSVAAVSIELAGVLAVGLFGLLDPAALPDDTVWSNFGQGYGFVPLLLPMIGLWWLYRHRDSQSA